MKSLAGIFAGTETFVRKVEETIKKKYVALEPSDSEGFGGNIIFLTKKKKRFLCVSLC